MNIVNRIQTILQIGFRSICSDRYFISNGRAKKNKDNCTASKSNYCINCIARFCLNCCLVFDRIDMNLFFAMEKPYLLQNCNVNAYRRTNKNSYA